MIVLVAALMLVQGSASASAFPAAPATPAAQRNMSEIPPEAARLIDQVMSPFCPGLILTNCPTMQADSLRKAIRGRIAAGATSTEVLADLQRAYGDAIRSAPDRSGFGLTAWVVPGASIIGAMLVLFGFIWRARRSAPPVARAAPVGATPDDSAADAALRERLAERLRQG